MTRWGKNCPETEVRFQFKHIVRLDTDCWEWVGAKFKSGYGMFWDGEKNRKAHRWSYEHFIGPIPEGLILDHFNFPDTCIGPSCVNPDHVRPVTHRENSLRSESLSALNRAKDTCDSGHAFTEDNTYVRPDGSRCCKRCRSKHTTNYRKRKKVSP